MYSSRELTDYHWSRKNDAKKILNLKTNDYPLRLAEKNVREFNQKSQTNKAKINLLKQLQAHNHPYSSPPKKAKQSTDMASSTTSSSSSVASSHKSVARKESVVTTSENRVLIDLSSDRSSDEDDHDVAEVTQSDKDACVPKKAVKHKPKKESTPKETSTTTSVSEGADITQRNTSGSQKNNKTGTKTSVDEKNTTPDISLTNPGDKTVEGSDNSDTDAAQGADDFVLKPMTKYLREGKWFFYEERDCDAPDHSFRRGVPCKTCGVIICVKMMLFKQCVRCSQSWCNECATEFEWESKLGCRKCKWHCEDCKTDDGWCIRKKHKICNNCWVPPNGNKYYSVP